MALFPEIDLSGLFANGTSAPLTLSPVSAPGETDETSGVIPGLDASLRNILQNYNPGSEGIGGISPSTSLVLPMENWAYWSYYEEDRVGPVAAGFTGEFTLFQVPDDERWDLEHIRVNRVGDNTIQYLALGFAAAYRSSTGTSMILTYLNSAADRIYWPDPADTQSQLFSVSAGPLKVEPGTSCLVGASGAGVATTQFDYHYWVRKTKITRALVP